MSLAWEVWGPQLPPGYHVLRGRPSQSLEEAGILDHLTGFALAARDRRRAVAPAGPTSSLVAPPGANKATAPFRAPTTRRALCWAFTCTPGRRSAGESLVFELERPRNNSQPSWVTLGGVLLLGPPFPEV